MFLSRVNMLYIHLSSAVNWAKGQNDSLTFKTSKEAVLQAILVYCMFTHKLNYEPQRLV